MCIYIPVWIDLKPEVQMVVLLKILDLHSSMDRFEVLDHKSFCKIKEIYIPVWIDLKNNTTDKLNGCPLNLHSSMDRFEA